MISLMIEDELSCINVTPNLTNPHNKVNLLLEKQRNGSFGKYMCQLEGLFYLFPVIHQRFGRTIE